MRLHYRIAVVIATIIPVVIELDFYRLVSVIVKTIGFRVEFDDRMIYKLIRMDSIKLLHVSVISLGLQKVNRRVKSELILKIPLVKRKKLILRTRQIGHLLLKKYVL